MYVDAIILNRFLAIITYYNDSSKHIHQRNPVDGSIDNIHFRRFPKLTYNEERVEFLKTPLLKGIYNIIILYTCDEMRNGSWEFSYSCTYIIFIPIGVPDSQCRAIIIYFRFWFFFVFGRGGRNTNIIRVSRSTVIYLAIFDVETRTRARKTLAIEATATEATHIYFVTGLEFTGNFR